MSSSKMASPMADVPVRSPEEFLVFGRPAIEEEEIQDVIDCLRSGWLGTGPRVAQFEREFRDYKGSGYPVALNSCTAALHLSLLAGGVGPGDEVITTAMTFCATVNAIIHAGATPVLADIDPTTMNIDPRQVAARTSSRTKAVIPVHFAGRACQMDQLCTVAAEHNIKIFEDCAHAIETEYKGKPVGSFGEYGCFSFYVTKNVVTGEGGMVLARDEEAATRIKVLGLHGMSKDAWKRFSDEGYRHYQVVECGFKYNMMDLQAAIGIHQLRRVEANWNRRQEIWRRYNAELRDLPIGLPAEPEPDTRHAYHLYTLMIDEEQTGVSRDRALTAMTKQNVGVGVHYLSIAEHPYYQRTFGWRPEDYPHACKVGRETLSIPLGANLTDQDVGDVIAAVRRACTSR
jgi:dTDP-4-amino-4,6-dideoxygalactose transaminase